MFGPGSATISAAYILAAVSGCPAASAPVVELKLTQTPPPIIENLGYKEITTLASGNINPDVQHALDATVAVENGQWSFLGLTRASMRTNYEVEFSAINGSANQFDCLTVRKIRYEIIYTPVVYIASDLLNKACTYNVVMAHEQTHVATDRRTIADYMPTLKQHIETYAQTIGTRGPYTPAAAEAERNRLSGLVLNASIPVWHQLTWLRRKRQAAIDTPQNYMREQARCPGAWIPDEKK